jgi:hypothetical protein
VREVRRCEVGGAAPTFDPAAVARPRVLAGSG